MPNIPVSWLGLELDHWFKLASLLGTAVVWLLANRRRPRVEAFFTHGASHQVAGSQLVLNTHALLVRNVGSLPATNVRITHVIWPQNTDVKLWPALPYTMQAVPPSGNEIVLERLRPKEQVSFSYLYPHPATMDHFGTGVKHDLGFGHFIQFKHARTLPGWARALVLYLVLAGLAFTLYMAIKLAFITFIVA